MHFPDDFCGIHFNSHPQKAKWTHPSDRAWHWLMPIVLHDHNHAFGTKSGQGVFINAPLKLLVVIDTVNVQIPWHYFLA